MKLDSLRRSVKGPAAAGFVPRIIRMGKKTVYRFQRLPI